jgi:acetyl esterase/lipase
MNKQTIFLILTCALLTSCRFTRDSSAPRGTTPEVVSTLPAGSGQPALNLPYSDAPAANPNSLSLDIYPTDQTNSPVLIFVHGGGWTRGDKSNVDTKPAAFNANGFVFVSVNYRLIPEVAVTQEAKDIAHAIAWVHQNIARYGGDPTRIFLMGHSAGAHLVSLIGTDETYLSAEGLALADIQGVISLDTQTYDLPSLMSKLSPLEGRAYHNAFGSDSEIWKSLSPQLHLAAGKNIPPFVVAYTGKQKLRTVFSTDFHTALTEVGVPALLLPATDKTHGQINKEFGEPGDTVTQAVFDWLKEILGRL